MACRACNEAHFNPSIYVQIASLLGCSHAMANGKRIEFSSKHLMDAIPWTDHGLEETIFKYCMLHGVYTKEHYSEQMFGLKQEEKPVYKITGFRQTRPHDLQKLMRAVVCHPVLICSRTNSTFYNYKGGVFREEYVPDTEEKNGPKKPDQYLQVVGFEKATEEWVLTLQNSLGTSWGEEGYMKVSSKVLESWGMLDVGGWYPFIGSDPMVEGEVYRKACIAPDGQYMYYCAPELQTGR